MSSDDPKQAGDGIHTGNVENSEAVGIGDEARGISIKDHGVYVEEADQVVVGATAPPTPRLRHIPISAPKPLIGREALLKRVQERLAGCETVLLFGLGGMGKTALAATIGEAAMADSTRYPDGVLWLTVLDRSLEALCDAVLRDEGITDSGRWAREEKVKEVRRRLGNQKLLIVLDDVNRDNPAAREWSANDGAHPANTPLLITSREHLPGFNGEEVKELERKDARDLLRHHADRVRDRLTEDIAGAICEALGDHPLAVEIMGALLNLRPMDLHCVPDELRDAKLSVKDIKTGDKKDQNVYASLALSWQRLDDDQKHVLTHLAACFAPGTGDELLGLICGLADDAHRKATGALFSHSLMRERANEDKWAVHALVKQFVKAEIGETAWEAARRVVLEGCVKYAAAHNGRTRADHDLLDAEKTNLLEAAAWAAHCGMHETVNRLAWDLYGVSGFLHTRGYERESLLLLEAAVIASNSLRLAPDVIAHLTHLGVSYTALGHMDKAVVTYEQSLTTARQLTYRIGEGNALAGLGIVYCQLGQIERSIFTLEQALAIAREINDRHGEANALGNLGLAYGELGQAEKSIEYCEQHLLITREIGDRRGEGSALSNLGLAYADLGQFEKAIMYYEQSLILRRKIGDRRGEGNNLGNLGSAYSNLMQVDKAITYFDQQLIIVREIGDRRGEASGLFNMALALEKQGRIEEAIRHVEQARAIFVEIKAPFVERCDEALAWLRGTS